MNRRVAARALYLDKAWSAMQALTRPAPGEILHRPAYRMFEGQVRMHDLGWDPWIRVIRPDEVRAIRDDLLTVGEGDVRAWAGRGRHPLDPAQEHSYVLDYLGRAQEFVSWLADDERGFVYEIG